MTLRAASGPAPRPAAPRRAARRALPALPVAAVRRRPGRTLAVVLALAAVTTAHAPAVITVEPGDTLWDLAREHGTSVSDLQRLNGLEGSGTIYAGQTLRVSGSGGSGGAGGGGGASHRVVAGETVSHLAARYGVSSRSIVEANGLASSGLIRIGQTLTIPGRSSGGGASTASVPAAVSSSVEENRRVLAARPQPSKAEVRALIADTARRHGVDVSLALAVAYHESGFQQRVVSPVNAIGVMQVLPLTGRNLERVAGKRLDLLDVRDNVLAGVLLLKQLERQTSSTDGVLAAYYQGLGSIAKKGILPQTHAYIRNVNALRARFSG